MQVIIFDTFGGSGEVKNAGVHGIGIKNIAFSVA